MSGAPLDEALQAVLAHIQASGLPPLPEFLNCSAAQASGVEQAPSAGQAEAAESGDHYVDQAEAAVAAQGQRPGAAEAEEASQVEAEPALGCVFCGVMGTDAICGPLQPAIVNGVPVMVHHLCALWSPQVYQQKGSQQYINLEEEYRRAEQRVCTACGYTGAAIGCTDPGCKCIYHLPCAIQTPNVFLDVDAFELWCPVHADNDDDDMSDDYGSVHMGGRGRGRATAVSRRQRVVRDSDGQRARTDWQKRDENTWVKVVPPWWAEHKTVHFATKVFKELFRSAPNVIVVDGAGKERLCTVQMESRNDTRQQYTLRGRFAEFWDASGVQAGDSLSFCQDPASGKVTVLRYAAMASGLVPSVAEQGSVLSQPAGTETTSVRIKQESVDLTTRGVSQQGSHPNRWMELTDGWCIKTVYKSTIAHQQCPVAGWLFKKLYGRLPCESDKAVMVDADLNMEYRFDVNFIGAANVHYITGRNFGAWMRESGLRAQEQIRVKKEGGKVLIQRVPSEMKVHVDFTFGKAARLSARDRATPPASAGAAAAAGARGAGADANPDDPMEALDSLAAAAGFAAVHGTPAIAAALAAPPAAAAAAAAASGMTLRSQQQQPQQGQPGMGGGLAATEDLQRQQSAEGEAGLALGKRRRTSTMNDSAALQAQLPGALHGGNPMMWQLPTYPGSAHHLVAHARQAPPQPFSPDRWEPSHPHMAMYQALLDMVAKHEWSQEEQEVLLKFRARFGRLDEVGREVTFFNVRQYQADRHKLLTILSTVAE